jgi:N-acyl-D-amino-acid deacylase
MYDLLIHGGRVIDGSGAPGVRADVAVRAGRIAAIGALSGETAARRLDAEGRVVAPGFIDMHAHDDFNLPVNPYAVGKVSQGVTTVVNGNCGLSPAPVSAEHLHEHLEITGTQDSGLGYSWRSMGEFFDRHPACGVNICQLVGHHAIRCAVMGVAASEPRSGELDAMKNHVVEAMQAGAFGFSTGLVQPPSRHATTDEVVALAEAAARFGGSYHTHMRNEGAQVAAAIGEALEVGRRSGAAVQISHLKISNPDHHGIADQLLAQLAKAREDGIDVHCDQYPYAASSGGLRARLPDWAQIGSHDEILARLADPEARARIRYELTEGMAKAGVSMRIYRWEDVRIGMSASRPDTVGLTLAELAQRDGKEPSEAMLDLLLADRLKTRGIYFHMSEEDVRRIMADPMIAIGSDGLYTGLPDQPDKTNPHPRHYGTFPRVLGRYCREEKVLELPEAVRKMTSLSARVLGLDDRGLIKPGLAADLVVFDPETIADRATFEAPFETPVGIDEVLVNGTPVVRDGRASGETPGHLLRRRGR